MEILVQIAQDIENKVAKIDEVKARILAAIERFLEYRTGLISAAVTGKIDIRNYRPKPEKEIAEAPCP